jgi:predicted Zn finger-like uncharacterized protein
MFIECPECATKFVVQAEQIGQGRKVRCSVCKYQWFYDACTFNHMESHVPFMDHSDDEPTPLPYGANVPAVIYYPTGLHKAVRFSFILSILFLMIVVFLLSVNRITPVFPVMEKIYDIFGVSRTDGLSLQDISIEPSEEFGYVTVQGVLVNQSGNQRALPKVLVEIYSKEQKLITSSWITLHHLPHLLPATQEVAFEENIPVPAPDEVGNVILNIGNSLELALR